MDLFPHLTEGGYEALHFFVKLEVKLRAVVAIHDSTLGPALGGARATAKHPSEAEAVLDALRLARGMTYKASLAGLDHGGGKAVILLPRGDFDRTELFTAFGRAVESLSGRYVTAEEAGTSADDMEAVHRATKFVVGHRGPGGSGDSSPFTALGVLRGIEAAANFALGRSDLAGLRVAVQGVGRVGYALCKLLHERGAKLTVADVNPSRAGPALREFGARLVSDAEICSMECDVFSPCAFGGVLNDYTVPLLRCKVIAGSANNQLAEARHGEMLARRGIVYVPDYAVNAGGLVNAAQEWIGYDSTKAREKVVSIYDTVAAILSRAKADSLRPEQVADRMAEERVRRKHAQ